MSETQYYNCVYCHTEITEFNNDIILCKRCRMPHHRECWEENENHCASCSYHRGGTVLDPPDSETEVLRYIEEENRRIEEERRRQEEEARRRQEEERLQEEQRQLEEQLRLLEESSNILEEEVNQTNTLEEQSQNMLTELSERERNLETELGINQRRENNNDEPQIIFNSPLIENNIPYSYNYRPEARNKFLKTKNKKLLLVVFSVILIIIVCLGIFIIIQTSSNPIVSKTEKIEFDSEDTKNLKYGEDYYIAGKQNGSDVYDKTEIKKSV